MVKEESTAEVKVDTVEKEINLLMTIPPTSTNQEIDSKKNGNLIDLSEEVVLRDVIPCQYDRARHSVSQELIILASSMNELNKSLTKLLAEKPIDVPKPCCGACDKYQVTLSRDVSDIKTTLVTLLASRHSALSTVDHGSVRCSNCQGDVRGFRYTCVTCANYDLCERCEVRGHLEHTMLRLAAPLSDRGAKLLQNTRSHPKFDSTPKQTLHRRPLESCNRCRNPQHVGNKVYRCLVCSNYEFCESCERHDKAHERHLVARITGLTWHEWQRQESQLKDIGLELL